MYSIDYVSTNRTKTNFVELLLKNKKFDYGIAINNILKSIEAVETVTNAKSIKELVLKEIDSNKYFYDIIKDSMNAFINHFSTVIFKLLNNPRCEYFIVYDKKKMLAGTINMVDCEEIYCEEKKTIIRYLTLYDWKTNIKLLPVNNKSQMFFVSKIQNDGSPFNGKFLSKMEQYFCQLYTYANILEKPYENCIVTNMYLINVQPINTALISFPNHKQCECFNLFLITFFISFECFLNN
uniref:Uncharacterized protein n=1 Tax=Glossina morsitans morsitans TaxID=37546 RepID=A0A1B0G3R2_GLOMM